MLGAGAAEARSCVASHCTTCAGTLEADAVPPGTVARIDLAPPPPDPALPAESACRN